MGCSGREGGRFETDQLASEMRKFAPNWINLQVTGANPTGTVALPVNYAGSADGRSLLSVASLV